MEFEALLIDRFKSQKHILESESAPIYEYFAITAEHVRPGHKIVGFPYSVSFQLVADFKTMLGMDEGYIVDDENVGFGDRTHILRDRQGAGFAVTPAIEGP